MAVRGIGYVREEFLWSRIAQEEPLPYAANGGR